MGVSTRFKLDGGTEQFNGKSINILSIRDGQFLFTTKITIPGFRTAVLCYQLCPSVCLNVNWTWHWWQLVTLDSTKCPWYYTDSIWGSGSASNSLRISEWAGLAPDCGWDGLEPGHRLLQNLQWAWGWQAWPQNMYGRVTLWVPGQAGLLPDSSNEGQNMDYRAAPRCADRPWSMSLILGHAQAHLPRRGFPDHGWELQSHFKICS